MLVLIGALKSITRAKGRNILIGIIALVIAVACCLSLSIQSSASKLEASGLADATITATIGTDPEYIQKQMEANSSDRSAMQSLSSMFGSLSLSDHEKYKQSELVLDFYYSQSASINASGDLLPYGESAQIQNESSYSSSPSGRGGEGAVLFSGGGGQAFRGMQQSDFTLEAYSSDKAMTKFTSGENKMSSGSIDDLSGENTAIVSKDLATYNSLAVGSTLTLVNPNASEETYSLTVAGIYTTETAGSTENTPFASQNPANTIIVSVDTLKAIADNSEANKSEYENARGQTSTTEIAPRLTATYVLKDAAALDEFKAELKEKGLDEAYTATSSDIESYEKSLEPLKNLKSFAGVLLLTVLAVGAAILIVINMFNIRERKYEVGVMTAMGIRKSKVAVQFVLELAIVATIAMVVGAGIGAAASPSVSKGLLEGQIASTLSSQSSSNTAFGRPAGMPGGTAGQGGGAPGSGRTMQINGFGGAPTTVSEEDYNAVASKFTGAMQPIVLLELIGIGLAITLISSLATLAFVMRYDPLKILANRS